MPPPAHSIPASIWTRTVKAATMGTNAMFVLTPRTRNTPCCTSSHHLGTAVTRKRGAVKRKSELGRRREEKVGSRTGAEGTAGVRTGGRKRKRTSETSAPRSTKRERATYGFGLRKPLATDGFLRRLGPRGRVPRCGSKTVSQVECSAQPPGNGGN